MKRQHTCRSSRPRSLRMSARWLAVFLSCICGCGALAGLDDYKLAPQKSAAQSGMSCNTHQDCKRAGASRDGQPLDFCLSATHACVTLTSPDCAHVQGPAYDERAVLLGSLFATSGAQGVVNVAREQSAVLAVEEINAAGGLPAASASEKPRPLALITCDASQEPLRAAEHLVDTLKLPAIIGPNNSQNTLDVARKVSIPGGTLTLSPTAVAASIADLRDEDLTWQMVPHDVQRGPLLLHEIGEVERALKAERKRKLKLSVIVRDDALGDGTRASLSELKWNGESLADAVNIGVNAKIDTYSGAQTEQPELVARHLEFAPDVVVLVGAGEAVSGIMKPLERGFRASAKPQYLVIDSSKVPELLSLVEELPDLAARVRGTGITPSPEAEPVNQGFMLDYRARYPEQSEASSSGVGPSYDATYAIAFALAAARGETSGRAVARGLRQLGSGYEIPLGPSQVLAAFRRLTSGEPVSAIGTFSRLAWDDRGAIAAGTLEIWCVESRQGRAVFTSSGLTADIPSQQVQGEREHCALPHGDEDAGASTLSDAGVATAPAPDAGEKDAGVTSPNAAPADAGTAVEDAGVRGAAGMTGAAGAAGTAASAPAAGSGSAGSGPRAGAGGQAAHPARAVPCGPRACQPDRGEYCCVSSLRPMALESDFSCETGGRTCAAQLRCTSDRECANGEICCMTAQRQSACRTAPSCGGSDLHLACDSPDDCGSGQVCCSLGSDPTALTATSCASSCRTLGPSSGLELCTQQDQCSTPSGCRIKPGLPTLGLCL